MLDNVRVEELQNNIELYRKAYAQQKEYGWIEDYSENHIQSTVKELELKTTLLSLEKELLSLAVESLTEVVIALAKDIKEVYEKISMTPRFDSWMIDSLLRHVKIG